MTHLEIILSVATAIGTIATGLFAWLSTREKTRRDWPEQMVERIEKLETREDTLQTRLDTVEDEASEWRRRFEILERECMQLRRELEAAHSRAEALAGKVANLEQENLLLRKQNEALHVELEELYRQMGQPRPKIRTPLPPPPVRIVESKK